MIQSFKDRATEDIFHGENTRDSRKIDRKLHKIIARKLDAINAARELKDLISPPGNDLKRREDLGSNIYAIRINDQFRIVFKWLDGNAEDVWVTDPH